MVLTGRILINLGGEMKIPNCAYHNKPMTIKTGQFGSFWSCGEKLADGTWCKYKPNKEEYPITQMESFSAGLDSDVKEDKKTDDIRKLNALNNACQIIARHPNYIDADISTEVRALASTIYAMELDKLNDITEEIGGFDEF